MGDKTGIEWTDTTWNPVRGCSRVSEGCRNCYAEVQAARIVRMGKGSSPYDGLVREVVVKENGINVRNEARWTGEVRLVPEHLADPLRWKRPRRIFVNSMSDLFHEKLTNEQIAAAFGVMAACPHHTFQILTKRASRMREWFAWAARLTLDDLHGYAYRAVLTGHDATRLKRGTTWPLRNVWLGVSVENQAAADERIPELLATPAAVRFLSCEPLLGPVDVSRYMWPVHWRWDAKYRTPEAARADGAFAEQHRQALVSASATFVDWIISGCESGPGARPCDVAWLRSLRDQCLDSGTKFFLKQAMHTPDEWVPGLSATLVVGSGDGSHRKPGGLVGLPYLDGVQHNAMPEVG